MVGCARDARAPKDRPERSGGDTGTTAQSSGREDKYTRSSIVNQVGFTVRLQTWSAIANIEIERIPAKGGIVIPLVRLASGDMGLVSCAVCEL